MLFLKDITVPKATLVTAPHVETLPLTPGKMVLIRAEFPPGCAELVGVQLLRGVHQVWPVTDGEYVSYDAGTVETADEFDVTESPHAVTVSCVNYDALHDHTVTVAVVIQPAIKNEPLTLLERLRAAL